MFHECGGNATAVARVYAERYPVRKHLTVNAIRRLDLRLRETDSLLPVRMQVHDRARFRTTRTPHLEEEVLHLIADDPTRSAPDISRELGIHSSTINEITRSERLRPYHYKVQTLLPGYYERRINYFNSLSKPKFYLQNYVD